MKPHPCIIALFCLGLHDLKSQESRPAITPEIRTAAEQGDPEAQFQLARAHLMGKGAPKDTNKAYDLMKSAADQGHADAIGGLGYFHSKGIAVEKDPAEAMKWFRNGAEKGSAKAQLNLGKCLLDEPPAAPDSDSGDPQAFAKRIEEGLAWVRKAADQGLAEAALSFGRYLYFGDHGLSKDLELAARYFNIAADQGDPEARNFLGIMSEFGMGMPLDEKVAEDWFRKAALQGHVKAQANLGRKMDPLSKDKGQRIEALAWLLMASDRGDVTAEKSLVEARPGLAVGEIEEARAKMTDLRKRISGNSRR